MQTTPCPSFPVASIVSPRRVGPWLVALALAPLLAAPVLADDTFCGIVNGRFVKDCAGAAKETPANLRAAECQRLSSEISGQTGMGSFPAILKKEDLQKLYGRRCNTTTTSRAQAGHSPECDRIAKDYYGLAGQSVQPAMVNKSDLLRQYDTHCAAPPPVEQPAAVIIVR
jgi:hypothetical protein